MNSVELFAGAGGLAIGMANAGFNHLAVVERDRDACETFRLNQRHHAPSVEGWPVLEKDAREVNYKQIECEVAVVSGGPPCQPFSMGGKHLAQKDQRNMFPEAIRAVRELRPRAFIFENVKGLMRESFLPYFSYIHLQLQYPDLSRKRGESWLHHRARLERHHSSDCEGPEYRVLFDVLNAADFGVPQKRERVFLVGFRADTGAAWSFPRATHSRDALLVAKWIDGSYWDEHEVARKFRGSASQAMKKRLLRVSEELPKDALRWRTTRDALTGLPDPQKSADNGVPNHVFTPGARAYPGHTGSPLDCPAKTLKAGHHGVPGGENMVVKDDGSVRYFTVREAARLQTFPDEFEFSGSWSQAMRQLGNAVPVTLAEVIAKSVADSLTGGAQS